MPTEMQEVTRLSEAAASSLASGHGSIAAITPGWGSCGYYSPQVLESAASERVWPKGTQMFCDHPSYTESMDRPERSVRDLVGVLTEDAAWDPKAEGNGAIVAPIQVFGPWRSVMAEMKDAIGVSIRASAVVSEGEAEGRRGQIVERLEEGLSIDFVTAAGRGGRITELLESASKPKRVGAEETSFRDRQEQLSTVVRDANPGTEKDPVWVWVRDFDESLVWFTRESNGESATLQSAYTVDANGNVALTGDPVEVRVQTTYVPIVAESAPAEQPEAPEAEQADEPPTVQPEADAAGDDTPTTPPESEPVQGDDPDVTTPPDPPADDTSPEVEGPVPTLTEAEVRALEEARDSARAQIEEANRAREAALAESRSLRNRELARPIIGERLALGIPAEYRETVRHDVTESVLSDLPVTETGELDQRRLVIRADAAVAEAATKAARLLEAAGAGRVAGLGANSTAEEAPTLSDLDAAIAEAFGRKVR